jgi:Flp pilus assembly protein TadG
MKKPQHPIEKQKGVVAVEFALIATLFFILLLGVVEMARVLFTWNSAVEATRYGARVAAVCDPNSPAILARMRRIMPGLAASDINVSYLPNANPASTLQVKVSIKANAVPVTLHVPVVGTVLYVPSFSTTLTRESLNSTNNPVCT